MKPSPQPPANANNEASVNVNTATAATSLAIIEEEANVVANEYKQLLMKGCQAAAADGNNKDTDTTLSKVATAAFDDVNAPIFAAAVVTITINAATAANSVEAANIIFNVTTTYNT